jgi:hypothetical protein
MQLIAVFILMDLPVTCKRLSSPGDELKQDAAKCKDIDFVAENGNLVEQFGGSVARGTTRFFCLEFIL